MITPPFVSDDIRYVPFARLLTSMVFVLFTICSIKTVRPVASNIDRSDDSRSVTTTMYVISTTFMVALTTQQLILTMVLQ